MNKKLYTGILLCITGLLCFGFISSNNPGTWELKKYENGIALYTREVPGSGFRELKAITTFNSTLSGLVALIKDIPASPTYVYDCQQAYILSSPSDTELYFYQETSVPWPVSNRDAVICYKIRQDKKNKIVTIESYGITGKMPEVEGKVRISELRGSWKFSLKKDHSVYGEYCLFLNPGVSIPDWLSNLFLIDGPYNTILKMKTMVTQKKYQSVKYNFISN